MYLLCLFGYRQIDASDVGRDVAGVDLPVAEDIKVLGVVHDRRLTFDKHVSVVARSCNYHAQAISVVRYPRYLDTYRRYLRDDTSIAKVTIYRGIS